MPSYTHTLGVTSLSVKSENNSGPNKNRTHDLLAGRNQIPITTGKKSKRGATGSSEDEISASNSPHTSTDNALCKEEVEEVEEVDTTKESNLYDVQTLFISIQRTTEKLSNKVGELKSSIRRLESERGQRPC